MEKLFTTELPPEVQQLLKKYVDVSNVQTKVFKTTTAFNVQNLELESCNAIINLRKINDIRFVNKFQEAVNEKLPTGGYYVGIVETLEQRKSRLLNKFIPLVAHIYLVIDFMFKRFLPKMPILKKVYFFITDGRNRVISKAEALGRLVCCGFKIVDIKVVGNLTYFVGKKEKDPHYDLNPSYGPVFGMNRIGKDGKIIKVFKLRTMYPYAEYLQEYIYEQNSLADGGKFADDFRITNWGRFIRKIWVDELPMILNLLKGEIKIVGVRPLSKHYHSLYSKELQEKRKESKPGLLPPFYVDMPRTLEEIVESELKYLKSYEQNPFTTDFKYLIAICNSIIFKKSRSK